MKFLIQYNLMNEKQLQLTKNAVNDFPHEFVGLIPFSREITSDEPLVGIDYIPYGSTLLSTLALQKQWKGLYFDLENFNYEASSENRDDMLNDEHIVTVKDAFDILKTDPEKLWFTRPSLDLKHYSGTVINADECYKWFKDALECDSSGSYKMDEDMMVVLATPKNIQAEWRWFIVGSKIVSGSMYRFKGVLHKERELDKDVIDEAQKKADQWLPNQCCVMDTALVDNELKVIEFNAINSSGFYDNDVDSIFKELYNYSVNI